MTSTGEHAHVLRVVDALTVGGLQNVVADLICRTQDRFRYSVCCVRSRGPVADRLERLAVPVHCLGKGEGHEWGLALRIARLCRALRPHIVHTQNWAAIDGVVGARLAGVPAVIHSEHGWDGDQEGGIARRNCARRLLTPFIDRVVPVSEHLQRWLVDDVGIRPDKVTMIRNGVDTERFRPVERRHELRTAAGYSAEHFVVGAMGRLDPVKNYPALLAAVQAVTTTHPDVRLLIVGDGPAKGDLEHEVHRRGLVETVRLVGQRDDVPEWLALMDVFVLPSLMEGTSNAVLEAMATGLPVVVTRVGGNPEIVVDGVTGRLVPARDVTALAEAIAFYRAHPEQRATHGAAGRMQAARYSVDITVAQYSALYQEVLIRSRCKGSTCGR